MSGRKHASDQALAQTLMFRAVAARKTLAELEHRLDERLGNSRASIAHALRELGEALEELRIATEQLETTADDLAIARKEVFSAVVRYRELHECLPVPCVLTDNAGAVDEANTLAASLLNVARPYLPGKPLLLFLPEREQYFSLVENLRNLGNASARTQLRPRDRKPREVQVSVTVLPQQSLWCWIFFDVASERASELNVPSSAPPPC